MKTLFGVMALFLVFAGCATSPTSPQETLAMFTLTDILPEYNGKYALIIQGEGWDRWGDDPVFIAGAQSINFSEWTYTASRISNGSVSIPVWDFTNEENIVRYTGNFSFEVLIGIYSSEIISSSDAGDFLVAIELEHVPFSNGNATISAYNGRWRR